MVRRKGELSARMVDVGWPHQVALQAEKSVGPNYKVVHGFCAELSICPRGHSVFHENLWWKIFCFKEREHAAQFKERFGGEWFDPGQRRRGRNWAHWNRRPSGARSAVAGAMASGEADRPEPSERETGSAHD